MKQIFDLEVTSFDEYQLIENWCNSNAKDWSSALFGYDLIIKLYNPEDAVAFRLTFGL